MTRDSAQEFNLDLSRESLVTTAGGLKITFDEALKNRITSSAGTNQIQVQVQEYFDKESFVFNNLQTITTEGELLESAGMFKIDLLANNKPILMKEISGLMLEYQFDKGASNYKMYNGAIEEGDISWNQPQDLEVVETQILPSNDTIYYATDSLGRIDSSRFSVEGFVDRKTSIKMFPSNFNWINIDQLVFIENIELAQVEINVLENFQDLSLGVVLKRNNSAVKLFPVNNKTGRFQSRIELPVGEQISILGFGINDEEIFIAKIDYIVGSKKIPNLSFKLSG